MNTRLRALRDDSGAMLVIALLVITAVSVVTGAVLGHGWTNFRATVELRGVAGTSYAGDAAAKVAINNLRLGSQAPGWVAPTFPGSWTNWVYTNNADGTGCFGATATSPLNQLVLENLYPRTGSQANATSARVECAVVPGTGIFGPGTGVGIDEPDPTDAFARALTTVGTSGAWQGMLLKPLGTGNTAAMPVRGGVASRSFITVSNGALVTDGYVKAQGACTGQIISSPAPQCSQPGSVPVPASPASPLTSVPTFRDPTAYAGSCTFQPGFYNNAKALSDAVNGCGTARFDPGQYYFDFLDEERGTGQNVWNVATSLIGGQPGAGTTIPGRCKSPILDDAVTGVQFVFGGTSRLTVGDTAHVELCGPSNGGDAPMTLYQQQSGVTLPAVPLSAQPAQAVTQGTGPKVDAFTVTGGGTAQAAVSAAGGTSLAWVASSNNREAALDLTNFSGLSGIPAGADITSAEVRIKYAKSAATPSLTVGISGTTPAATVPAANATGWASVELKDQLRTLIQSGPFSATRPKVELRLPGTPKDGTLTVDAITLAVTYVPPSLRKAQDVAFITTPGGNFHGELVVHGATFAPNGYVALDPGSFTNALVAFRWGLVALGVDLKAQPSQQFGYPLVSIPDAGHGLGNKVTVVDLKVSVCVQQATCATGGDHVLTARVMITDPPYGPSGAPVPGKRRVEVLSWAEQR